MLSVIVILPFKLLVADSVSFLMQRTVSRSCCRTTCV